MNTASISSAALEKSLAARRRELLGDITWLRGSQVKHVDGASDAGFDLLATSRCRGEAKLSGQVVSF